LLLVIIFGHEILKHHRYYTEVTEYCNWLGPGSTKQNMAQWQEVWIL